MASSHSGSAALVPAAAGSAASSTVDHADVQDAIRALLCALGRDATSDALSETPRRVADAYAELLTPQHVRATTFPNAP
jgi:GTP cyclohydrolase I